MDESIPSSSAPPSPPATEEAHHDDDHHDAAHSMVMAADQCESTSEHQSCMTLLRNAIRNPDQLTAMISNYSTSYNAVNVGIVLPVLNYSIASKESGSSPRVYGKSSSSFSPQSIISSIARRLIDGSSSNNNEGEDEEQDSLVASSLLAGMIFGQLIGGFLGDVMGRRNAMMLMMILQIGGSLGSAFFISINNTEAEGSLTALEQLAIWRFVLGIGAGGVYPLAAVMSAENKQEDDILEEGDVTAVNSYVAEDTSQKEHGKDNEQKWGDENDSRHSQSKQNGGYATSEEAVETHFNHQPSGNTNSDATISSFQRIALTFSTQGLGFITVPLLAYPMLELRWNIDAIWRVLLAVGALPGVLVLYLRLCSGSNRGCKNTDANESGAANNDQGHTNTSNAHGNEISKRETSEMELPVSNKNDGDGDNANGVRAAISSLFSDITSSDINDAIQHNENDLALVESSHLGSNDIDNPEECARSEDGACNSTPMPQVHNSHSRSLWESIQAEPNLGRKFAGTAGTWFLFDVLFYGNTLFEPLVLEAAFGSHSSSSADGYELLQTTVRDSLVISLLSLPGYFVTVLLIGRRTCVCRSLCTPSSSTRCGSSLSCFPCYQTPAYIQMQGFLLMFILYTIIGLFWTFLSNVQWLLLLLYAGTFFFANYGPNSTTFLLPSVTYSEECRSTLNGISAAAGKFGALVGASVFAPAANEWGESVVMVSCGFVSLIAWALTKVCLGRRVK